MEPVQPPERGKPTAWAAVDKRFRAFDPHQGHLAGVTGVVAAADC